MPDYELDRADCKILEIVQRDGRISNVDLAGHVALSPSPCLRRLSRLEESGIIAQYVALVDPSIASGIARMSRHPVENILAYLDGAPKFVVNP